MNFLKMKPVNRKLLIAEIILLIASVLIFRSAWLLLDSIPAMNEPSFLITSLIVGFLLTIPALRFVIKNSH